MQEIQNQNMRLKQVFNPGLLDALLKQERVARTWLSQQPNLDLIYLNDLDKINNDLFRILLS